MYKLPIFYETELSFMMLAKRACLLGLALLACIPFIPSVNFVLLGLLIGFTYATSLIVTKRIKMSAWLHTAVFFGTSLLRIVFFGYALLWTAQGDRTQLLLVFAGFLGYSSWLFLERLIMAFSKSEASDKLPV